MIARTPRPISAYDEIVLHMPAEIPPARARQQCTSTALDEDDRICVYTFWIYANIPLPVQLGAVGTPDPSRKPPQHIGGLPLVGREELTVRWKDYPDYAEYLRSFCEDTNAHFDQLLFDSLSDGIRRLLLSPPVQGERPLRIWWSNEALELDDIAWEPFVFGQSRARRLSGVRGRPRGTLPPLPLSPEQPLRLAIFDPTRLAPGALHEALDGLGPGVKPIWLEEREPRVALSRAVRAGYEGLHIVADGSVPFGVEGLLEFPGGATLSPTELISLLRGSRITLLSLSEPEEPQRCFGGPPTVFRSFARVARELDDGPTTVAPLAPIPPSELGRFWRTLYRRFAESLDVEDAFMHATPCPQRVPVVLYLRHRFGRQFVRLDRMPEMDLVSSPDAAARLNGAAEGSAALAVTGKLLNAVVALEQRYPALKRALNNKLLLTHERERQNTLTSYLEALLAREKRP